MLGTRRSLSLIPPSEPRQSAYEQARNHNHHSGDEYGQAACCVKYFVIVPESGSKRREFAIENKLPSVYTFREHVEADGLIAYSPKYHDLFRRAAGYVDKILKGTKPGEPVARCR